MTEQASKVEEQTAQRIEEGQYYRVLFIAMLDPDAPRKACEPRPTLFCPDKRVNVFVPAAIAEAAKDLADLAGVVSGAPSDTEESGYLSFVRRDAALRAADAIEFYAGPVVGARGGGGYLSMELEVAACLWETFGEPAKISEGERIKYVALGRRDESSEFAEEYLVC